MATKLLVSETKIKSFTNINKNVDIDLLRQEVKVAQDLDLQSVLGSKFLNSLLDKIQSTGTTFTADEKDLVDNYIADYLIHAGYYYILPQLHLQTRNVGVVQPSNIEGGKAGTEIANVKYLTSLQQNRRDFYKQRLMDVLNIGKYQNVFVDYISYTTLDGLQPDKNQKYNNPIFTGDVTDRYGNNFAYRYRGMNTYAERWRYGNCCS